MNTSPLASATFASLIGTALAFSPCVYAQPVVPLKEAKLNIEHNFTDEDTGFQGAIDSEGWNELTVTGPDGVVLNFEGRGKLRNLGLTELFFETVEPENAVVPLPQMLSKLPAGNYSIAGTIPENQGGGTTAGTAWLTHVIPKGPRLRSPGPGAHVPAGNLFVNWDPVTETINGGPVTIIAYQLIIEKDGPPHRHMIGKPNSLSMYLRPSVTQITIPGGFFEPGTTYQWEVLAIERSGNQTLSSSEFETN